MNMINALGAMRARWRQRSLLRMPVAFISNNRILCVDDKKKDDELNIAGVQADNASPANIDDNSETTVKQKEPLPEMVVIDIDLVKFFKDPKFAMDFDTPFLSHEDKYGTAQPVEGEPMDEAPKAEEAEVTDVNKTKDGVTLDDAKKNGSDEDK